MTELGVLAERYLAERRKRGELDFNTWRDHSYSLAVLVGSFGHRPVRNLSRADIDRWLEAIGHLAPATRRRRVSVVRGLCAWLVDRRHIPADPMRGLRAPRPPRLVPRALPHDAVCAALAAAPDQRARLLIVLMVQEGLRCAEVARLQFGDVDRTYRQLRVAGKGDHERIIWITDETIRELDGYLNQYPGREGPLIRSYRYPSQPIGSVRVGRIVGEVLRAAGVKQRAHDGVSAHALRHTAATDMLRAGAHVRDVQAVLGHVNLANTERYLPRMVGNLEDTMEGRTYSPELRPTIDANEAPDDD